MHKTLLSHYFVLFSAFYLIPRDQWQGLLLFYSCLFCFFPFLETPQNTILHQLIPQPISLVPFTHALPSVSTPTSQATTWHPTQCCIFYLVFMWLSSLLCSEVYTIYHSRTAQFWSTYPCLLPLRLPLFLWWVNFQFHVFRVWGTPILECVWHYHRRV